MIHIFQGLVEGSLAAGFAMGPAVGGVVYKVSLKLHKYNK